jgi:hypothetical protein
LPYIFIDNPLVFTQRAKDKLTNNQNAAWDIAVLKSLMQKFESSAEELEKLFGYFEGYKTVLTIQF